MATHPHPTRRPAGTPAGGQFAPSARPKPKVSLDAEADVHPVLGITRSELDAAYARLPEADRAHFEGREPRSSGDGASVQVGNVEVRLGNGIPGFAMPGATAGAERGLRDRARAAFINSDIAWPLRRIEVSQRTWVPGRIGIDGAVHPGAPQDLAVAAGLLEASGRVPEGACEGAEMIGRLGLDGSVHPIDPEVAQRIADETLAHNIFVAPGQELLGHPGTEVVEVGSLRNLADRLEIAANRRASDAAQASHDEAIAYLSRDGDLRVLASRYGRTTSECAEVAWLAARAVADETGGEPGTHEDLDYAMYLAINDHDDIANLLPEEDFR